MTPRQQEAHKLKEQGLTNTQIARELGVSQPNVSILLNPERHKEYQKEYRLTDKYKKYQKDYYLKVTKQKRELARNKVAL